MRTIKYRIMYIYINPIVDQYVDIIMKEKNSSPIQEFYFEERENRRLYMKLENRNCIGLIFINANL